MIQKKVSYIVFSLLPEEQIKEVSSRLKEECVAELKKGNTKFWVDLCMQDSLGGSIIGTLSYLQSILPKDGRLVISGVSPRTKEILKTLNFDKFSKVKIVE